MCRHRPILPAARRKYITTAAAPTAAKRKAVAALYRKLVNHKPAAPVLKPAGLFYAGLRQRQLTAPRATTCARALAAAPFLFRLRRSSLILRTHKALRTKVRWS